MAKGFGKDTELDSVNPRTIDEVEKATMERANYTIGVLDDALKSWEYSVKPENLRQKFVLYHQFSSALKNWRNNVLNSQKADYDSKVRLLWEFVDICQAYT